MRGSRERKLRRPRWFLSRGARKREKSSHTSAMGAAAPKKLRCRPRMVGFLGAESFGSLKNIFATHAKIFAFPPLSRAEARKEFPPKCYGCKKVTNETSTSSVSGQAADSFPSRGSLTKRFRFNAQRVRRGAAIAYSREVRLNFAGLRELLPSADEPPPPPSGREALRGLRLGGEP